MKLALEQTLPIHLFAFNRFQAFISTDMNLDSDNVNLVSLTVFQVLADVELVLHRDESSYHPANSLKDRVC